MAKIERIYTIPLRKQFLKAPRYKRAKKAMLAVRQFVAKHMKVAQSQVKLGPVLNETVWERGIKSPPHHVKVTVIKEDDLVKAELFGYTYPAPITQEEEKPKKEAKKEEKPAEKKATKKESITKATKEESKTKATKEDKPKAQPKKAKEDETPKVEKKETKKEDNSAEKPKKETKDKPAHKKE